MSFFTKLSSTATKVFSYTLAGRLINWLTPKAKTQDPQELQTPPTAKQGDPIRIVFGPFRIEQSNCVDWGDVYVTAVKAKVSKKG